MLVKRFALPKRQLEAVGLNLTNQIHYQLTADELVENALMNGQGRLNDTGALVISTGQFTGRSPRDKFVVKDEVTSTT
ncbi:MAG TPA: phosphoenolpyruvate carboxykinase (ATP), partial [Niabella sp.]